MRNFPEKKKEGEQYKKKQKRPAKREKNDCGGKKKGGEEPLKEIAAPFIKLHLILKNDKICGVISTITQLDVQ